MDGKKNIWCLVETRLFNGSSVTDGPCGQFEDTAQAKEMLASELADTRISQVWVGSRNQVSKIFYVWGKDGEYVLYDSMDAAKNGMKGHGYVADGLGDALDKGFAMFEAAAARDSRRREMEHDRYGSLQAEAGRLRELLAQAEHQLAVKKGELMDDEDYQELLKPGDKETLLSSGLPLGNGPVRFTEDNTWFPMQDPDMPDEVCLGHGEKAGREGAMIRVDVRGVRKLDAHTIDQPADGQVLVHESMCFGDKKSALALAKAYQEENGAGYLASLDDSFTDAVKNIPVDGMGMER